MDTISNNSHLWLWLGVITLVGGLGMVFLLRAYRGNGSQTPRFDQPLPAAQPTTQPPAGTADLELAAKVFAEGNAAFGVGRYRWAADQYTQALQVAPNWAEAYHHRGLAVANLGQTGDAAQDLAKAANLYLDGDNLAGLELVRQQLQQLKA
jgi:tetratricopeptide (TPR) repeat protein